MLMRLREWRNRRGFSVRDLAERAGVNASTITRLENSDRPARARIARKLAEALAVDVTDLYAPETDFAALRDGQVVANVRRVEILPASPAPIPFNATLPLAVAALAAGHKDKARPLLIKLLKEEPTNRQAWLYLAAALPRDQAVQALKRLLIVEPDNRIALRNLARLREHPDPNFCLDLSDVWWEEEPTDLDGSALFGHEQPTARFDKLKAGLIGAEEYTLHGMSSVSQARPRERTGPVVTAPPLSKPAGIAVRVSNGSPAAAPRPLPAVTEAALASPARPYSLKIQPEPELSDFMRMLRGPLFGLCAVVLLVTTIMLGVLVVYLVR